jgi:hypothetical protein
MIFISNAVSKERSFRSFGA